jgi:hypothetical protein
MRLGARGSEELRLPGPRWAGVPTAPKSCRFPDPWNLAGEAPKSSTCPVPTRRAARRSEELRPVAPGWPGGPTPRAGDSGRVETWMPLLRRGAVSLSRVEPGARGSEELHCLVPTGWAPDAPKSSGFLSRWRTAPGTPRGAGFRPPVRRGARGSEELRLSYPDGTPPGLRGGRVLYRVESSARGSEERRLHDARDRTRDAMNSAGCPAPGGRNSLPFRAGGRVCEEEVSMR